MLSIYQKYLEDIYQGDIFVPSDNEILDVFKVDSKEIPVKGFIVTSNSCDIVQKSIDYICISPIISLQDLIDQIKLGKKEQGKNPDSIKESIKSNVENIVKYKKKKYFYLPENSKHKITDNWVVLLEMIFNYKLEKVNSTIANSRISTLLPPWREKLGWSVGNLYNRIALQDFQKNEIDTINSVLNY